MKANHSTFKETAVGILLAAYQFGFLITAPLVGDYAAKLGRKNVIVYGIILMTVGCLLFSLAAFIKNDDGFYAVSMIGRLI